MSWHIQRLDDGRHQGHIKCDGCGAESPTSTRKSRELVKISVEMQAWKAGFVPYGHEWKCETCRVRGFPDSLKRRCPEWCERLGIPVPPEPAKTPPRRRKEKVHATAAHTDGGALPSSGLRDPVRSVSSREPHGIAEGQGEAAGTPGRVPTYCGE